MLIFLESPWPILLIGIAAEAAMGLALLRSGQGKWLWAMLGVGVVVVGGLLAEHFVVTDRKLITRTLDTAAAAVEANNLPRLLDCISPDARKPRADSKRLLGRYVFKTGRIYRLDIKINRYTSPPTAKVHFLAFGEAEDRQGLIPRGSYSRGVEVELRWENNRWLVTDYSVDGLPQVPL
jgi:hypothetical protein